MFTVIFTIVTSQEEDKSRSRLYKLIGGVNNGGQNYEHHHHDSCHCIGSPGPPGPPGPRGPRGRRGFRGAAAAAVNNRILERDDFNRYDYSDEYDYD